MSTTIHNPVLQAQYEVETLTARIADNEAIYGPGCRPELRARLAAAQAVIAEVNGVAVRQRFTLDKIRVTEGGAIHIAFTPEAGAVCGALPSDLSRSYVQHLGETDAHRLAGSHTCGRCRASIERWWRED